MRQNKYSYESLSTFPANFFRDFVEDGLKPFLKYYGYELGFSPENRISYCTRWAYSYSKYPGDEVEFTKWMHTGLLEDYEWYIKFRRKNGMNL